MWRSSGYTADRQSVALEDAGDWGRMGCDVAAYVVLTGAEAIRSQSDGLSVEVIVVNVS